jgi:hypothetical protein
MQPGLRLALWPRESLAHARSSRLVKPD